MSEHSQQTSKPVTCAKCATEFYTWKEDVFLCFNCDGRPKCQRCNQGMTKFSFTTFGQTTTYYDCLGCNRS